MSFSSTKSVENLAVQAHRKIIMERRVRTLANNIAQLIPTDSSTILDVGAGTGELAKAILDLKSTIQITGTDVYLRPKTFIPVIQYDGNTLPFAENTFDLVMTVDVLHHCTDPIATLKECARVASKGVIIKDHISNNKWDKARLRFMDWVGNRAHGVILPYNYLSQKEWLAAFEKNSLTLKTTVQQLKIYPQPADLLFGGSLHCLYFLQPVLNGK